MSQANVFTSLSANTTWYTDKCEIVTGAAPATYQVYITALGTANAMGNLYSAPPQVAANWRQVIYVGAGNKLTITGSSYTLKELGTQTSAQSSVFNSAGN